MNSINDLVLYFLVENIKNLGSYTLQLQAVLNESGENMFAGKQLPCEKINFQVVGKNFVYI
jgi:hypothetical protein